MYDGLIYNLLSILGRMPWIEVDEYSWRAYDARMYKPSCNITGIFVHMLNGVKDRNSVLDAINSLLQIDGEVCVSEIGDRQLSVRQFRVGVLLKGELTAQFEYDCWSEIDHKGKRYAGNMVGSYDRKEGWIIPSKSQIVGLIYNGASKTVIEKIAWDLGIDTFEFRCINAWEE